MKTGYSFLSAVFLSVLVLIAYEKAPDNGFHFDDRPNIVESLPIRAFTPTEGGVSNVLRHSYLPRRAIANLSFAVDWWRGGGNPRPFQYTNIGIHVLCSIVLFLFLRQVLIVTFHTPQPLIDISALAGALLWALHPIQTQAVTYIVQRMTSLATLFSVLSVLCYILARRRQGIPRVTCFILSALWVLMGFFSKEIAVITPLLILLAELGVVRNSHPLAPKTVDRVLLLAPVLFAAWVLFGVFAETHPFAGILKGYHSRDFTLVQRLLTQPRVIAFHVSQLLWPMAGRFALEHDFPISTTLLNPPATLAAVLALLLWCGIGAAFLFRTHKRVIGFFMLWVPATLALESSFVPLEMVFEHRMYLPTMGFAGLVSLGIHRVMTREHRLLRYVAIVACTCVVGILLYTTRSQVPVWRTDLSLSENSVRNAPGSSRAWANLGWNYLTTGSTQKAQAAFTKALEFNSSEHLAFEGRGVIAMDRGELAAARFYFEAAGRTGGTSRSSWQNHMGELLLAEGKPREALNRFVSAREAAPWMPASYWNMALAYERLGDCAAALDQWKGYLGLTSEAASRQEVLDHIRDNYTAADGFCHNR